MVGLCSPDIQTFEKMCGLGNLTRRHVWTNLSHSIFFLNFGTGRFEKRGYQNLKQNPTKSQIMPLLVKFQATSGEHTLWFLRSINVFSGNGFKLSDWLRTFRTRVYKRELTQKYFIQAIHKYIACLIELLESQFRC